MGFEGRFCVGSSFYRSFKGGFLLIGLFSRGVFLFFFGGLLGENVCK